MKDSADYIRVATRVRPSTGSRGGRTVEADEAAKTIKMFNSEGNLNRTFHFDNVFGENSTQVGSRDFPDILRFYSCVSDCFCYRRAYSVRSGSES